MADHNKPRYRSDDPFDRETAAAAPTSDPLAELARLIGQTDPFADLGPVPPPRQPVAAESRPRYDREPAPFEDAAPHHAAPYHGSDPAPHYNDPEPHYRDQYVSPHGDDDQPSHADWHGEAAHASSYSAADPFALPSRQHAAIPGEQPFEDEHRVAPLHLSGLDSYPSDQPSAGPVDYASAPDQSAYVSPPSYPEDPEAGAMPPPHDDEFYDDAPRASRRKGLLTVAAVLGLAVIGTAGAFGYRNFFGGAHPSSPPPVIRAAAGPTKVAPPPSAAEQSANKFTYDRFGDRGKDEQVVVREEKPINPESLARSTAPGSVFPGAPTAGISAAQPSGAKASATVNPPSVLGEPRRVRTVPIRPDRPEVIADPQPTAVAPVPPPPPRSEMAMAAPAKSAVDATPSPAPSTPPVAARASSSHSAPRVASHPPPRAPAPVVHAPLSLSPPSTNALPPPVRRENVPSRAASAPMRLASAPTHSGAVPRATSGGRYLVQVSSQRSEADANASFRHIQAKYPNVLGGQPHVVRRADLGRRGIYYRAMVGPFATRQQAVQLCSNLKAAGGNCIVH